MTESRSTKHDIMHLETIIMHCDTIEEAINIFGKDEEDFLNNVHYQNDCVFALSQIGELVKRLPSDIKTRHPDTEWNNIAKLRDLISHNYVVVELSDVWEIINKDVPPLKKECEHILSEIKV